MTKPEWESQAFQWLLKYARQARLPFTIEEAREWIGDKVDPAPDLRWWGNVTRSAIRDGHIKRVSFAPARSSNGSPKPTYTKCQTHSARITSRKSTWTPILSQTK